MSGDRAADAIEPVAHGTDPDITVANGRTTLGFLFDNADGTVSATDQDGVDLGTFDKRAPARAAIIQNSRRRQ